MRRWDRDHDDFGGKDIEKNGMEKERIRVFIVRYSDRRRRSVEGDRAFKLVEVSRLRSSSNTLPHLGYAVVNCSTPRPSTRIPRAYISIYPFYPFAVTSSGSRYTCLPPFIRIRKTEPTEYFQLYSLFRALINRHDHLPSTFPSSFRFSIFTFENVFENTQRWWWW